MVWSFLLWRDELCAGPVSLYPVSAGAQALFTRLLLPEPGSHLIHMTSASSQNLSADRDAGERQILRYLYACFRRAQEEVGTGCQAGRQLCHPALCSGVTELKLSCLGPLHCLFSLHR